MALGEVLGLDVLNYACMSMDWATRGLPERVFFEFWFFWFSTNFCEETDKLRNPISLYCTEYRLPGKLR